MHSATTLNVAALLDQNVRLHPERTAIVSGDTRLTYGELDALACQVAGGLRARGIGQGERVALSCPNVPYFPVVYFGILKAGATVVPLNVPPQAARDRLSPARCRGVGLLRFEGTPELPMAAMAKQAVDEVDACRHFVVMPRTPGATVADRRRRPVFAQFTAGQAAAIPDRRHAARRHRRHPVHLGHDRPAQGRRADARQPDPERRRCADIMTTSCRVNATDPVVALVTLPLFHSFGQVCQMLTGIY